jgi:glycosyltransferase involved in cell wall biosynthesis
MHLVLFFTRGVSLKTWAENGSLEREIALYLRLQQKGIKVSFVTYGDIRDLEYEPQLQGIQILCNRWNLPLQGYEWLLPLLHASALRRADGIKTNQTNGADVALRAANFWHKPLIARCGYMWSDLLQAGGKDAAFATRLEQVVFQNAQAVVVTTPPMKDYIQEKYGVSAGQINVIPNYVLTDIFSPENEKIPSKRISFVGRLSEHKNLHTLLEACSQLEVDLHFIGEGELRNSLRERALALNVPLTLHGSVPHSQLPALIRQSDLFVLVSPHEGHPKSLLEAMSCGVAVLGADSPGIREQIVHGETGWLCGTDAQSMHAAIEHLLSDPELRKRLGANARKFIEENYSLERIVEMEINLLKNYGDIK